LAASPAAVTLEQYLAASYRPDVEFLDGALLEKPVVSPVHGRVQILLGSWFGQHEDAWSIQSLAEARTQVSDRSVRLPDLSVLRDGPLPRRALTEPPLIAIEVLSETDTETGLKARARDLEAMGTRAIWLIDPSSRTAQQWSAGAWRIVRETRLELSGSPVFLDLGWLWDKLGPQS